MADALDVCPLCGGEIGFGERRSHGRGLCDVRVERPVPGLEGRPMTGEEVQDRLAGWYRDVEACADATDSLRGSLTRLREALDRRAAERENIERMRRGRR
jgi:hypothetical protein